MPGPPGVKLRDSCESCAASKVRCSKEKPACNRCTDRGTRCQYSVQQRTGRKFRQRGPSQDGAKDATSSQDSSTSPFFPELDTVAEMSFSDPSFGTIDSNLGFSMNSDSFKASQSSSDSQSLPVVPPQNLLSHPNLDADHIQNYPAVGCSPNDGDVSFQSFERFLSAFSEPGSDSEQFGLTSPVSSFSNALLAPQIGAAWHGTAAQRPDSLETALQLMQQLSSGEDHLTGASLSTTGCDSQTEALQLPAMIERNKKAMEAVRNTLQTTVSHDGYLLVVVCLVVSKVLTTYEATVSMSSAPDSDGWGSSVNASSAAPEKKDPLVAQRVLDELYQVQASMDQLGHRMQLWAKHNQTSGTEAFPIGNDTSPATLAGFPFSVNPQSTIYRSSETIDQAVAGTHRRIEAILDMTE
ncbi:MAG: hypothetical protein Q9174_001827 [Haloplaca sp. 1 TL-2023]